MKKTLIAAAVLLSLNVQCAEAAEVIVSTLSYHFFQKGSNNENLGLHFVADNGLTMGFYRNSMDRDSQHIGYSFPFYKQVSMTVGAVTGYAEHAYLTPYFSFGYRQEIDKNWGITYTVGGLQVINVGPSYHW